MRAETKRRVLDCLTGRGESVADIAAETSLSPSAVRRALRQLGEDGEVESRVYSKMVDSAFVGMGSNWSRRQRYYFRSNSKRGNGHGEQG